MDLGRMDLGRTVWNAVVYSVAFVILGVTLPKAVGLAVMATVSALVGYGSRWLFRFGFGLMVLAMLVALNIVPTLDHWGLAINKLAASYTLAAVQKTAAQAQAAQAQ